MLIDFILDGDELLASLSGHAIPEENALVHTFGWFRDPYLAMIWNIRNKKFGYPVQRVSLLTQPSRLVKVLIQPFQNTLSQSFSVSFSSYPSR